MSFDLRLQAKEGQFATWRINDLRNLSALRTRAGFTWFGQHERWAPNFKIQLAAGDEEVMLSAGGRGRFLEVMVQTWRNKDRLSTQLLRVEPEAKEPVGVWLYWTPDGTVTTVAAREGQQPESVTVKLPRAPTGATITVSTAAVVFDPLEFGTGAP